MTRFSTELVTEMADLMERRSGRRPTYEQAQEALENLTGFFQTLIDIDDRLKAEGKLLPDGPASAASINPAAQSESAPDSSPTVQAPRRRRRRGSTKTRRG